VPFLESVGDVLEEKQAEDDVPVLAASILPRRCFVYER